MVLVAVVLCMATGYVLSEYVLEKHFVSTAQLFIERTEEQSQTAEEISASQQLAANAVLVLKSPLMYDRLNQSFEETFSAAEYDKMITVSRQAGTQIIDIKTDCNAALSAYYLAEALTELSPEVISGFIGYGVVKVMKSPDLPTAPAFPSVEGFMALGALAGLLLSIIGVLIIWLTDKTISPEDDILTEYNVPVFAEIIDFEARIPERGKYKY